MNDLHQNILPFDGIARYFGPVINTEQADEFFQSLMQSVTWKNDVVHIFGKTHILSRKSAWYGDKAYSYTYSKITKTALPWIPALYQLKQIAENETGAQYNSCLLNLYHSGEEAMSWHCDNEPELQPRAAICSVSLGAARRFLFKHRLTGEKRELTLEHGSILCMSGVIQSHWLHQLPRMKRIKESRINLTFRSML